MTSFYIVMSLIFALTLTIPVGILLLLAKWLFPEKLRVRPIRAYFAMFGCIFLVLISIRVCQMCRSAESRFHSLISPTIPEGISNLEGRWDLGGPDPIYVFRFSCSESAYMTLLEARRFQASTMDQEMLFAKSTVPEKWWDVLTSGPECHTCMVNTDRGPTIYIIVYSKQLGQCVYLVART